MFAPQVPRHYDPGYSAAFEKQLAQHAAELAAVVVEPVVQGAGGMRFHDARYLADLRDMCSRHEVLLILDEIATGFGRTGELFAADHAGVSPDIMCVGKALTGGYLSLAATLCTTDIAHTISAGEAGALMHGPTFMANPLACAVSVASIEVLLGQDWRSRIAEIAADLAAGLKPPAPCPPSPMSGCAAPSASSSATGRSTWRSPRPRRWTAASGYARSATWSMRCRRTSARPPRSPRSPRRWSRSQRSQAPIRSRPMKAPLRTSPLAWLEAVERQRREAGLRRSLRPRPAVAAELDLASTTISAFPNIPT